MVNMMRSGFERQNEGWVDMFDLSFCNISSMFTIIPNLLYLSDDLVGCDKKETKE